MDAGLPDEKVTVSAPSVTANSVILLTQNNNGETFQSLRVESKTPGTGFVVRISEPKVKVGFYWMVFN